MMNGKHIADAIDSETDWAGAMRYTTVHNRYHVGGSDGLECTEQRFGDAVTSARSLVHRVLEPAWIYDVMARKGGKREWRVDRNGAVHCVARRGTDQ